MDEAGAFGREVDRSAPRVEPCARGVDRPVVHAVSPPSRRRRRAWPAAAALVAAVTVAAPPAVAAAYPSDSYGDGYGQPAGGWYDGSGFGYGSGDGTSAGWQDGTPSDGSSQGWDDGSGDGTSQDSPSDGTSGDGSTPTTPSTPSTPSAPSTPVQVPTRHPTTTTTTPLLPATRGTINGTRARLRTNGKAAVPRGAPAVVRAVIAAANQIVGKPYKWGGGHARLADTGYDCSGTVSYALIKAGLLSSPMVSGQLAHWGRGGAGRWITVYANATHVYMEVAGLRLDTSPYGDPTGRYGVRWRPIVGRRGGFAVRHPTGL